MLRHRQVRLSYPQALVELALLLALRHDRRNCAKALGLPLSTVYRWLEGYRRQPERIVRIRSSGPEWLDALITACEAHGFYLRSRVCMLESAAANSGTTGENASTQAIFRARLPIIPADARPALAVSDEPVRHAPGATPLPVACARVALARAEIDHHYYSQLSCEMLAGIAGMSRFHFIHKFKAAYAIAPYRYLMQVRIHHAKLLLSTTQQPLDAIAAAVGFDTQSSMCKAFRGIEGVTLATFFRGVRLGSRPLCLETPATAAQRSASG